jgi:predicted helicase
VTTFRQLLEYFEQSAKTQAAKGKRFEDFCEAFLQVDKLWADRFDAVWTWQDWPDRPVGLPDTGVDLVARERGTGNMVAIQCKFYSPSAVLGWEHISTFVAMLSQAVFASGMIISTAGAESANLHKNIAATAKHVVWWRVEDFEESLVDWNQFRPETPTQLTLAEVKSPRPYQEKAIADVVSGFAHTGDRGQLLMACGTGKTFTSLRIAEQLVGAGGVALFLVPSINLLSQSVIAWANDATIPLSTFAVCSDRHAGQRKDDDMSPNDLQVPASTDVDGLMVDFRARATPSRMAVVFCTYQSIDVIVDAQRAGLPRFDLVVCDEAHRTTGSVAPTAEQSAFTKVHDESLIKADKRLYMTATPRIYGDQTKAKAKQHEIVLSSMDDPNKFGAVFHDLPFGRAVADGLLTDYKVLVIAVNQDAVSSAFQRQFADASGGELPLNDVARMIGCWHGLSKRGPQFRDAGDEEPMRRAVAFSSTIAQSKRFTEVFPNAIAAALEERRDRNAVRVEARHVDGRTNVKVRQESIAWLEEPPGQRVCRVLSNAKCLTEGVDVPALDAVMFLNPRKSVVDVVQAVGRVMRKLEGKEFGYVILPIGVPGDMSPEEALRDSERYAVVWEVLQALRSHDERLRAEINKIDINKTSSKISVIGIGLAGGDTSDDPGFTTTADRNVGQMALDLPDLAEWRDALYARIVEKVGDRQYMEHWAKDIADIAAAQEARIRALLEHPDQHPAAIARFDQFHSALRDNLNDAVSESDAISMLSQHLITRPVFEALFGGDAFTRQNPVSQVMQSMIDTLDDTHIAAETQTLDRFYDHIRMLLGGITSADGRQRVIAELYEKFFKKVVPKTAASLGIVYTPVEVVDFINRSVNDLLGRHFGASLSDAGVHVLDPFTGTGTFVARLIQSGLIAPFALQRKYAQELHANEIMLLAYYIAAINIENAYRGAVAQTTAVEPDSYEPFNGIVLADTFQMTEDGDTLDTAFFPRNNERADHQKHLDIRVIVGNPPYSGAQDSQNDDNANLAYPTLDRTIERTYAARSTATLKNSLYNSYLRAFRWASNRITGSAAGGIVAFVSNNGFLDDKSADGIRFTLTDEFHHIYIFNLRGNQRTSGERSRREGGKIFGSGSRNGIAITLLVKQQGPIPPGGAQIHYYAVADYLDRASKLALVDGATVEDLPWVRIRPNEHADWARQRDPRYAALIPLTEIFHLSSNGLKTNRDPWVYNSSRPALVATASRMIEFYNDQLDQFTVRHPHTSGTLEQRSELVKRSVDKNPRSFSWDRSDYRRIANGTRYFLDDSMVHVGLYRPFFRSNVVMHRTLNNEPYQLPRMWPTPDTSNPAIGLVGAGNEVPFSVVASELTIDQCAVGASSGVRVFSRWRYEPRANDGGALFNDDSGGRSSNITGEALERFRSVGGPDTTADDVFYYVYGVLHSRDFRNIFEANLKKEAPRVPIVANREDFGRFIDAGRELFYLHANFDAVDPYELTEEWSDDVDPKHPDFDPQRLLVGTSKMSYPQIVDDDPHSDTFGKKIPDRSRLKYNDFLTLSGIPDRAQDYEIGTRSGIDWIIDRWHVTTNSPSGIVNDVNQWGLERGNPRYIIDLIKQVVTVALRTADIIDALPTLDFDDADSAPDLDSDAPSFDAARKSLRGLAELRPGWLDGDGVAVPTERVEAAGKILDALESAGLPPPLAVSATAEGAVRLEWHGDSGIASIDCEDEGEVDVVASGRGRSSVARTYESVELVLDDLAAVGALL